MSFSKHEKDMFNQRLDQIIDSVGLRVGNVIDKKKL